MILLRRVSNENYVLNLTRYSEQHTTFFGQQSAPAVCEIHIYRV